MAFAAGHLTVDLGLLSIRLGPFAIDPGLQTVKVRAGALEGFPHSVERLPTSLEHAAWSRSPIVEEVLTLLENTVALVGSALALVRNPFAVISDSLTLVGAPLTLVRETVSFVGAPLLSSQVAP